MGKITLKVREVSESKGINNPFALSQNTGINYAICYRLWHSQQRRVDLGTLERLCDALKGTPPGRLFEIRDEIDGSRSEMLTRYILLRSKISKLG